MLEAVNMVRDGSAPKIVQDEAQATYESWCRKEDVQIDWGKPIQEVWNLIRGADPQPGAWSTHNGQEIYIYDAKKHVGDPDGQPGGIVAVGDTSFTVAAQGGCVEVLRVRPEGGRKIKCDEFISSAGLQAGARLGA